MRQPWIGLLFLLLCLIMGAPVCTWSQSTETNPGIQRPVTTQEVDQLKRKIYDETRSNLEGLFEYHTESGDINNRLDFYRVGARLNLKLFSDTLFQVRGTYTPYLTANDVLAEWGKNVTVGFKSHLGEGGSLELEVGGTKFSTRHEDINALAAITFSNETRTLKFTGSRSSVEESLLSATGVRPVTGPFAGRLVGQVMDNRFIVDTAIHLSRKLDVFANGGAGFRDGSNVESNLFQVLAGGGGYNVIARADDEPLRLVRVSYSANYSRFDKDLLGFGGASLMDGRGRFIGVDRIGSDGMSPIAFGGQPGVGGYFSPRNYFSHVVRGDAAGHPTPGLEYEVAGFVGSQYYTGSSTRLPAHGFSGTVTFRLNESFTIPVTFVRDNFGPFTQQSLFGRLVARF